MSARESRWAVFALAAAAACGAGFAPQTLVQSVRVLVVRADKPFAKPGDKVHLQALAVDQRPIRPSAMGTYWIPFPCINPRGDSYYACFSAFVPNAGPPGKGSPSLPAFLKPGADITDFLTNSADFDLDLPADIVATHAVTPGAEAPYGLAVAFFVACAGRVRIAEIDPSSQNPQVLPIRCTDEDGHALGPDDWVFAFTRVYAYDAITNANPELTNVTFDGQPVSVGDGVTVAPCASKKGCATHALGVDVPDSSWEPTPDGHEAVYWTAYRTAAVGDLNGDGRLVFDAVKGRVGDPALTLTPPPTPGEGKLWLLLQDTRGGASWVELPVHVK